MSTALTWGNTMPRRAAENAPTPAALALAATIERFIADQKWSNREAARKWGMNDSTLGKIINKKNRIPEPETMRQLAAGMGMPVQRLYELVGMVDPNEEEEQRLRDAALYGMSRSDLEAFSRLSPEDKAKMGALARSILGE